MLTMLRKRSINWIAIVVVSGVGGFAYAAMPAFGQSDDAPPPGGVPVEDPTDASAIIQAAGDYIGFAPLVPSSFPTSADRLIWVDASTGSAGTENGLHLVELVYEGAPFELDGFETTSTLGFSSFPCD